MSKKLVFVGAAFLVVGLASSLAISKPGYKKDLGAESCATCHVDDKKAPNPSNKLWKSAQDMAEKTKAGKGEFAGKAGCADCHKGQMKPAK